MHESREGGRGRNDIKEQEQNNNETIISPASRFMVTFFCVCLSFFAVVDAEKERIPHVRVRVRVCLLDMQHQRLESPLLGRPCVTTESAFTGTQHTPKKRETNNPLYLSSLSLARPLYCSLTW